LAGLYRRFGPHLKDQQGRLLAAAGCVVGVTAMEILRPWPLKVVFDAILVPHADPGIVVSWLVRATGGGQALVAAAALAILVVAMLGGLFGYGQSYFVAAVGQKLTARIRAQLYGHIQRLSPSFHDRRNLGDLLARLSGDVLIIRDALVNSVALTAGRTLVVLSTLAVMLAMDWRLTILALAIGPLLVLALQRFGPEIKGAARKQRRREGEFARTMAERIAAVRLVQAFAREAHEEKRFARQNRSSTRAGMRAARLEANLDRLVQVIVAMGTCGVVWYGVVRVQAGALTPGDLLVFTAYLKNFYKPVQKLAQVTARTAKAVASGERVAAILDLDSAIKDAPDAIPAPPLSGAVRFEGVSFAYDSGRSAVLDGLDLVVRPGETVAITGPSGMGKSTLANLLLRFYEPTAGRVTVDGLDLRRLKLETLRAQIAVVLQEPLLFAASVRENIAYGRLDATDAEIEAAARAAEAHDFIAALPDGYDTVLGERGGTLSGGQRQRIAIARAVVRDAPIVILDEPMTGLDRLSEAKVRAALERLMRGRTCLLISHDSATLAMAQRVLRLEAGRLVEAAAPPLLAAG
jgi:ABC-type multidrug transport system fused ATPase/permease subunit